MKKIHAMNGAIVALMVAIFVASIVRFGWGVLFPIAGGAWGASCVWMRHDEKQNARIRRLRKRNRKLRRKLQEAVNAEENRDTMECHDVNEVLVI